MTHLEEIAFALRMDLSKLKILIQEFGLFLIEEGDFYSPRLNTALRPLDEKRAKQQAAAHRTNKKRWVSESLSDPDTDTDSEAVPDRSTVAEYSIDSTNSRKRFTPPLPSDVEAYFTSNGYSLESAQRAFRYYDDAGWRDSNGKQVKNWKQKMQGVWFKPENRIPQTQMEY